MPQTEVVVLIFAVLLGLAFGSFLNVCVARLPRGESIVKPASRCTTCGAPIRKQDNIPVVSWLLLRGRCRECKSAISVRYPLVEAATAALFVTCAVMFGLTVRGVGAAIFCWLLLGLAVMDAETFLLPNAFTLPGLVLGIAYSALTSDAWAKGLLQAVLAAAGIGGALLLVALLYKLIRRRQGMGLGDVKLAAMLGAWLGWRQGAVALFLGILGGAIAAVALAFRHQRRRSIEPVGTLRLPFGTFLAGGAMASVFFGARLLQWYLGFFP